MTEELRRLLAEATPGPWRECKANEDRGGCSCGLVWSLSIDAPVASTADDDSAGIDLGQRQYHANAALIAAAVNALPGLLDVVDAARRTVASDMTGGHTLLRDALARPPAPHDHHDECDCGLPIADGAS